MAPAAAVVTPLPAAPAPAVDDSQREFFKSLLDELKAVRKQNQELHDQVAETNRDLMELQFRVDTHSESFRPLKVTSEAGTLQNELSGVLPPKALPAE
jgi:septal ring factor EnvC (AmiA/AmiB activator)